MNIPGNEPGTAVESVRREPIAWLETLNKVLGTLIEIPAALLVLAEVIVLLMGVTSRYVLHKPLVWSDELASILFLWLAMLGSIVAFQRGEHMRMTAIVGKLGPSKRAFLDLIAIASAVAFLAFVVHPSYEFASDEAFVTTPAMGIPNSWRAAALPIGLGLMLLVGIIQIFRIGRLKDAFLALGLVALVIGGMALVGPLLTALGNWNLFVFFVLGVGAMVLLGLPIAFSFGLATFGYIALTTSTPTVVIVGGMDEGMSHLNLLAVPLFVLLGLLIEMTGIARAMVNFLANLLGHVRGGLSYVLIGAMYLVSGIAGSKAADTAAVAPALFPEMRKRGAKPGDLVDQPYPSERGNEANCGLHGRLIRWNGSRGRDSLDLHRIPLTTAPSNTNCSNDPVPLAIPSTTRCAELPPRLSRPRALTPSLLNLARSYLCLTYRRFNKALTAFAATHCVWGKFKGRATSARRLAGLTYSRSPTGMQ